MRYFCRISIRISREQFQKYYDPSLPLGTLKNPFKSVAEAMKYSEERKLESKPATIDPTHKSGEIEITVKL